MFLENLFVLSLHLSFEVSIGKSKFIDACIILFLESFNHFRLKFAYLKLPLSNILSFKNLTFKRIFS